jgi:Xaa-Pro aminopeptidase
MPPDPFAPALTARRRARLAVHLRERDQGAAMVATDPSNIRYLSGFQGSNGALLLHDGQAVLVTDSRYVEQARSQVSGVAVEQGNDVLAEAIRLAGDRPVLLEGDHLTAGRWEQLSEDDARLRLTRHVVEDLRAIKDDAEAAALAAACQVSQEALRAVLATGVRGRSERAVARQLEWLLAEGGGEGPGFASIVAAGPHSAIPHHRPTDRTIEQGDLLKIDFGATVAGYHADITRTFVVAAPAADWQAELHDLVAAAHAAARAVARPGAPIADVDAAARTLIAEAGHREHFGHGLGHGVGLAIHERPLVGPRSSGTLAAGMAITIEPGCYLPGMGGVRIEDTVLIGDGGYRSLVTLPRELTIVH